MALQHFLKEDCRFTKASVRTFGIGPVGVWLSAAAWVTFTGQRLELGFSAMQAGLQEQLAEHLGHAGGSSNEDANNTADEEGDEEGVKVVDFKDLSPSLQREFQLVQGRASADLGPLALKQAAMMQRLIQAKTYEARLLVLRECVEDERRRLEAKRTLRSLGYRDSSDSDSRGSAGARGGGERGSATGRMVSREETRSMFERLMSASNEDDDPPEAGGEAVFQ